MGCDIHGAIEYYAKHRDRWNHERNITVDRWYNLFGVLAGVRNYVNAIPIAEPKGLPKDIDYITEDHFEVWIYNAHSMSWLTLRELQEYDWEQEFLDGRDGFKKVKAKDCINLDFEYVIKKMEQLAETFGVDGVRVVFWFDS